MVIAKQVAVMEAPTRKNGLSSKEAISEMKLGGGLVVLMEGKGVGH